MASQSLLNVIGTLSLSAGLAISLERHTDSDEVRALCLRLRERASAARQLWPHTDDDENRMALRRMVSFYRGRLSEPLDAVVHTSWVLGLLDQVWMKVRGEKKGAIDGVMCVVEELHDIFAAGSVGNINELYFEANSIVDTWEAGG